MSTQVQFRRGNTAQTSTFTGATAEITVDTDKETIVVHDGSTAGGFPLAKESALTANQVFSQASFNTANGAFAAANAATATDTTQNNSITAAFTTANSAGVYANGAFAAANAAEQTAITAGSYANSAFTRANNSLNANTGGTVVGDVSITGNLTVSGLTTYTNTTTLLVADNIITVNAAINQSAQPTVNAGIEVDRGAQPNTSILWIETLGKWTANNGNGSITLAADSAESYANAAFLAANAATATNLTQNNNITAAFTAANTAAGDGLAFAIALG